LICDSLALNKTREAIGEYWIAEKTGKFSPRQFIAR